MYNSWAKSSVCVGGVSLPAKKAGTSNGKIAAIQQLLAISVQKECVVAATSAAAATTSVAAFKNQKETLMVPREWHDSQAKSGVVLVGNTASPAVVKAGTGVSKIAAVQQQSATSAQEE